MIEQLNREIRRRTRVVGSFPDGNSALMLVCARLRHVASTHGCGSVLLQKNPDNQEYKFISNEYHELPIPESTVIGESHSKHSAVLAFFSL